MYSCCFLVSSLSHTLCNMFEPTGRTLHQLKFGVVFTKALNIIIRNMVMTMMMLMVMMMTAVLWGQNCDDHGKTKP